MIGVSKPSESTKRFHEIEYYHPAYIPGDFLASVEFCDEEDLSESFKEQLELTSVLCQTKPSSAASYGHEDASKEERVSITSESKQTQGDDDAMVKKDKHGFESLGSMPSRLSPKANRTFASTA